MQIRVLRHTEIGGERLMSGSVVSLSVFDKILEDGRLVYHYGPKNQFEIIPADLFKIVYSSYDELQAFMDAPKYVKSVKELIETLTEENKTLKRDLEAAQSEIVSLESAIDRIKEDV